MNKSMMATGNGQIHPNLNFIGRGLSPKTIVNCNLPLVVGIKLRQDWATTALTLTSLAVFLAQDGRLTSTEV